jgi:hypothetical protein
LGCALPIGNRHIFSDYEDRMLSIFQTSTRCGTLTMKGKWLKLIDDGGQGRS